MELDRFVKAQECDYDIALNETRNGKKRSHWMWYIFPQIKGLGYSSMAQYYGIQNRKEAEEYLNHPLLGIRLREITTVLLNLESVNVSEIFGYPDDIKLKSSMSLFYLVSNEEIFKKVLEKYFDGNIDNKTIELLDRSL